MNKIYKVIWSKVKNCYIVVSELAKRVSRSSSPARASKACLAAVMAATALTVGTIAMDTAQAAATTIYGASTNLHYAVLGEAPTGTIVDENGDIVDISTYYEYRSFPVTDNAGNPVYNGKVAVTKELYVLKGYDAIIRNQQQIMDTDTPIYKDLIVEVVVADETKIPSAIKDLTLISAQSIVSPITDSSNNKVTTVLGTALNSIGMSTYIAAADGGTLADKSWDYIIEDTNGKWVNLKGTDQIVAATYNQTEDRFYYTTTDTKGNTVHHAVDNNENVYYLTNADKTTTPYVFLRSDDSLYTGTVRGLTNEILMTAVKTEGSNKVLYTYWGAKLSDDQTLVSESDITVGDLNKAFRTFEANDKNLAEADITNIKLTQQANGGTLGMVRNNDADVLGEVTISSTGGTNGQDVKVQFSNQGIKLDDNGNYISDPDNVTTFTVDAGSKVVANGGGTGDKLSTISVNGKTYTIVDTDTNTVTNIVGGSNVTVSDPTVDANGNKTYTISATDTNTQNTVTKGDNINIKATKNANGTTNYQISATDTNNYVTSGSVAYTDVVVDQENELTRKEGTLTLEGEGIADVTITGLRDTTLRHGYAEVDIDVNGSDNEEGTSTRSYTIYDTAGNAVVLKDVASHLELQDVIGEVEKNTTNIATNETSIKNLTTTVNNNSSQISTNTTNIATNTQNITNLTTKVDAGWDAQINGTTAKKVNPTSNTLNFVAKDGGNVTIEKGANGEIVFSATDTNTVTNIAAGNNVTVSGGEVNADGTKTYTIDGKKTTVSTNDANLTITAGAEVNGVTDYNVSLNESITLGTKPANQVMINGLTGTLKLGNTVVVSTSGIDMGNTSITKLAAGVNDNDAVNVSQLKDVQATLTANDQHLVVNPNTENGHYKVAENKVTLNVQGKNEKGGTVYTDVVIDDVASKTELDTLDTRVSTNETNITNIGDNITNLDNRVTTNETNINEIKNNLENRIDDLTDTQLEKGDGGLTFDENGDLSMTVTDTIGNSVTGTVNIGNYVSGKINTEAANAIYNSETTYTEGSIGEAIKTNTTNITNLTSTVNTNTTTITTLTNTVNKGWNLKVNNGEAQKVQLGDTVTLLEDTNISVTSTADGIKFATTDDVTFDTVATNSITVGNTVTVNNTGIDMGNKSITNLAAGQDDNDAVNVSQLNQKVTELTTTINNAKTVVEAGNNVTISSETDQTTGQVTYTIDGKKTTVNTDDANLTITAGAEVNGVTDYNVSLNESITLGTDPANQVMINGLTGTLKLGNTVVVSTSGIDMGNTSITKLAAGVNDNDAVNVSQLKNVQATLTANDQHLVVNPNTENGHYKVAENKVTLNVQGKNANGETVYTDVVIDDVASKTELDVLDTRVTTNETNITNLGDRVTNVEGNITNLDNRVTTNETNITNLDNRVTTNETNIKNIQGDITNLDNRVTTNETNITNLDNRVTTNETNIKNIQGDITDIRGDITNIEGDITNIQELIENMDGDFTEVSNNYVSNITDNQDNTWTVNQTVTDEKGTRTESFDIVNTTNEELTNSWEDKTSPTEADSLTISLKDSAGNTLTTTINDVASAAELDAETQARIDADTALGERIDAEEAARIDADNALSNRIDAEAQTRADKDAKLEQMIKNEAQTRLDADTALNDRIDDETKARQDADTSLSNRIDTEEDARIAGDDALRQMITDETTSRTEADQALSDRITNEEKARQDADTALSDRINEEAAQRQAEDASLSNRINEEAAQRQAEDASLSNRISQEVSDRIANDIVAGDIDKTDGTVTLTKGNGETISVGNICDSRLDDVTYDANAGKLTFTVTDHYNQDQQTTLEVSDIASKTALEKEVIDRQIMDNAIINDYTNRTNYLDNRINSLGNRVNKVGAGAAALAALHPLDFDPDDKLSFSAGVGNYAGATAAAIGAFYRPNERVMFSIGGTTGNGENMVNAGISFALGKGGKINTSRVAMTHEINDLRQQVAYLSAVVAQLSEHAGYQFGDLKPFPDTAENHWAYEYVSKLAAEGIVDGYPNGTFKGDRAMTRYEFAAMLYRALEKGYQLDTRIIDEFEPELGRLSVERIKGEQNHKNKIERVRVNDEGEDRDVYGSKINVGKTW